MLGRSATLAMRLLTLHLSLLGNTPSPPDQHASAPLPPGLQTAGSGVNRTASDLLLQVLQGNSLDLRAPNAALSNSPVLQPANAPLLAGAAASNALAGRSIWSGPTAPAGAFGNNATWTGEGNGNNAATATEALFNSMPNENQQSLGARVPSNISPFGSIGQKQPGSNTQQSGLPVQQVRQHHPFAYQNRQPYDRSYG